MDNIKKTYDYTMFKFGAWNREIKQKNLLKIDRNVKREGWLKHPIMVNEDMEVIDGQHRLIYAKTHNLPVYYIVVEGLTVGDCVIMNNVRTAWTVEDYIRLYSSQNNENYIRLQKILDKYSFLSPYLVIALLKGNTSSGNNSKTIKNGTFELSEEENRKAEEKLGFLEEIYPYIKAIPGRPSSLVTAIAFCYDLGEIDNKRLKNQIKSRLVTITPPANIDMALKELEAVYNYRIDKDDYVYISTEYKKYAMKRMRNVVEFNKKRWAKGAK